LRSSIDQSIDFPEHNVPATTR